MARQQHKSTGEKSQPDAAAPSADTAPLLGRRRLLRLGVLLLLLAALIWKRDAWLPQLVHPRVRAALADRQPDVALKWLDRLDTVVDGDPESAFLRARAYRKQGDMEQVRVWLQKALDRGLDPERVRREEWLAYAQSGQMQQAERHLPQLLTSPEQDVTEVYDAFVTGYIRTYRLPKARRLLEAWIENEPDSPRPHLLLGQVCQILQQHEMAAEEFRSAIELNPDDPAPWLHLGDTLLSHERPDEAADAYRSYLNSDNPTDAASARLGLAIALRMAGDLQAAEQILKSLDENQPPNAEVKTELGRLAFEAGNSEAAIRYLQEALELKPFLIEARYMLAQSLVETGRRKEAAVHFEKVEQGRAARARIATLRDDLGARPDDVELRFEIATLSHEFDAPGEAMIWYQSVLALDPDHQGALQALNEHHQSRSEPDATISD